jgi:hypothetical protein
MGGFLQLCAALMQGGDHRARAPTVGRLGKDLAGGWVAEAPVPLARLEIGRESCHAFRDRSLVQQRKRGHARPHLRIKVEIRATPEGSQEPVDAIVGNRDRVNAARPQLVNDLGDGRTPPSIVLDVVRKVDLGEPEAVEVTSPRLE